MALRIEWLPEVKKEDWDVAKAECKYSACGNYRVCKIIPLTRDSRPRWGACFLLKSKDNVQTWWPITTLENGEPKTYRTEDMAFEACDMHADGKHKGKKKKVEELIDKEVKEIEVLTPKPSKQKPEVAAESNGKEMSNKARVYLAWRSTNKKWEEYTSLAPDVQPTTIRNWISSWKRGQNLPAIAKVG